MPAWVFLPTNGVPTGFLYRPSSGNVLHLSYQWIAGIALVMVISSLLILYIWRTNRRLYRVLQESQRQAQR